MKSYIRECKLNFKVPPFIKDYEIQRIKFMTLTFVVEGEFPPVSETELQTILVSEFISQFE